MRPMALWVETMNGQMRRFVAERLQKLLAAKIVAQHDLVFGWIADSHAFAEPLAELDRHVCNRIHFPQLKPPVHSGVQIELPASLRLDHGISMPRRCSECHHPNG